MRCLTLGVEYIDACGDFNGLAWGENIGWINFAPVGGGVVIDPATGVFSGYAWGEGWGRW